MILTGLALFFGFLFLHGLFKSDRSIRDFEAFDYGYLLVLAALFTACIWTPLKFWRFETMLSEHASTFAQRPGVTVKCTSVFDSIFDPYDMSRAGSAFVEQGEIIFHHGWCKSFMDYLDNPLIASDNEIFSMHVFTHEVMHIRGELDEKKTDCQAIQRNHLLGQQMGVNRLIARRNAVRYYKNHYKNHPYYSKDCAPRKALDERLPRPIWRDL